MSKPSNDDEGGRSGQHPNLGDSHIRRHETPQRSHWDEHYARAQWPLHPDPQLVELLGEIAPGRAVDLGCGTGRNAVWLATRAWDVTGIDASAVGLSQAARRAEEAGVTVRLVQADLLGYELAPGTFELVVMANLHFPPDEREQLFEHAKAALAPGGHIFVTGHHVRSLGRGGPPDPDRLYTEELLARLLVPLEAQVWSTEHSAGDGGPPLNVVAWATAPAKKELAAPAEKELGR
ncbi:MAG: class I SAM-dependent methyltransferase [Acidimicrobiales bacterium]